MHCERVFAILTRGPFPSGEVTDVAVELHLAHCLECRRLAEALRPCDSSDATTPPESIDVNRSHNLPGYRGDHVEWRADNSLETRIAPRNRQRFRFGRAGFAGPSLSASRFAAAIVLGIVIGAIWSTVSIPQPTVDRKLPIAAASMGSLDPATESRVQAQLIGTLDLSPECRQIDWQLYVPMSNNSGLRFTENRSAFVNQCCTQCHAAGRAATLSAGARETVIHSCNICHSGKSAARGGNN